MKQNYKMVLMFFLIVFINSCSVLQKKSFDKTFILKTDDDQVWYFVHSLKESGDFKFSPNLAKRIIKSKIPKFVDIIFSSKVDYCEIKYTGNPFRLIVMTKNYNVTNIFSYNYKYMKEYLSLLREYSEFDNSLEKIPDDFFYSVATNENLVKLRKKYKLDDVAGNGTETEKIINLMKWAHNIVEHDGTSDSPKPQNALNLISVCEKEKRGVNCRMLATILNEAYLSMGFFSRHVTCLPFDKEDSDCHVINMVFSKTLDKWLYMDPSFEMFFMDANSNLLSIIEVREKMINNETLLLNDKLNHNGNPIETEDHLRYMAKNLFRFSCPLGSEFGYESKGGQKYWVYLIPKGYEDDDVFTSDNYWKKPVY